MKTRIIVDSTADLVPEVQKRVHIVPLTVHFGQEEYVDGVTIDHKAFYEKLIESDVLPTTSQATPNDFAVEFEKAKEAGEAAIVITLASKFSGTCQSAMIAAGNYENIYVIDSTSVAMGSGILVELALRLLDEGKSTKEAVQILEEEKKKIAAIEKDVVIEEVAPLTTVADVQKELTKKVEFDEHIAIAPIKEEQKPLRVPYKETEQGFKSSPIISPVYGIERKQFEEAEKINPPQINSNELALENTANYEKFDAEIRKTNEFIAALKELQKKLD